MCTQQAEATQNHKNEHVRSIEQKETRHENIKSLKSTAVKLNDLSNY
jgi:hypothetical protein